MPLMHGVSMVELTCGHWCRCCLRGRRSSYPSVEGHPMECGVLWQGVAVVPCLTFRRSSSPTGGKVSLNHRIS